MPNMVTAVLADYRGFDTLGRGHRDLHRRDRHPAHPANGAEEGLNRESRSKRASSSRLFAACSRLLSSCSGSM